MAHFWLKDNRDWRDLAVPAGADDCLVLRAAQAPEVAKLSDVDPRLPVVMRVQSGGQLPFHVLLDGTGRVRVNGKTHALGITILANRDELRGPGLPTLFFSDELTPKIAPFDGETPKPCALCTRPIEPGEPSVRCPRCGLVFHQGTTHDEKDLHCWTYGPLCRCRQQATALDNDVRWTPRSLTHTVEGTAR